MIFREPSILFHRTFTLKKYNSCITAAGAGRVSATAADDGLVANDGVLIRGGTLQITAEGDGIKATKAEVDKGYVYIGGSVAIDAGCDGVQAETSVLISGGTLAVTSGGGSANTAVKTGNAMFGGWDAGTAEETASTPRAARTIPRKTGCSGRTRLRATPPRR